MRSGIIAKKMGMTRIFNDNGQQIPVTILRLEKVQVVAQKTGMGLNRCDYPSPLHYLRSTQLLGCRSWQNYCQSLPSNIRTRFHR